MMDYLSHNDQPNSNPIQEIQKKESVNLTQRKSNFKILGGIILVIILLTVAAQIYLRIKQDTKDAIQQTKQNSEPKQLISIPIDQSKQNKKKIDLIQSIKQNQIKGFTAGSPGGDQDPPEQGGYGNLQKIARNGLIPCEFCKKEAQSKPDQRNTSIGSSRY